MHFFSAPESNDQSLYLTKAARRLFQGYWKPLYLFVSGPDHSRLIVSCEVLFDRGEIETGYPQIFPENEVKTKKRRREKSLFS